MRGLVAYFALSLFVALPRAASAQELGPVDLSFLGGHLGRVERLEVNGARFEVRTGHHEGTLADFATAFRARCVDPLEMGDEVSRYFGCSRVRDEREGFRLVWAHQTDHGLLLVEVVQRGGQFETEGDVPGGDLPGVPRPPNAVRVLRVSSDAGLAAIAYEVPAREEVLSAALQRIEDAGWVPVAATGDRGVVRFRRGSRTIDAVVTRDDGSVRITFLEAPVEGERD